LLTQQGSAAFDPGFDGIHAESVTLGELSERDAFLVVEQEQLTVQVIE
jgi:hypothetical protein